MKRYLFFCFILTFGLLISSCCKHKDFFALDNSSDVYYKLVGFDEAEIMQSKMFIFHKSTKNIVDTQSLSSIGGNRWLFSKGTVQNQPDKELKSYELIISTPNQLDTFKNFDYSIVMGNDPNNQCGSDNKIPVFSNFKISYKDSVYAKNQTIYIQKR